MASGEWRRGWDSNPRMRFTPINGLANPPDIGWEPPTRSSKAGISTPGLSRKEREVRREAYLAKARESAQYDPRSGKPNKSLAEILSRYAVVPSGCWEWTGTKNKHGYGIVCLMLDGKPNTMPAPRLQWMRCKGKPGDGMDVCHACDNPPCINPEHLFGGTPLTNIRDMIAKGRHNFTGLKYSGASAQNQAQRRKAAA